MCGRPDLVGAKRCPGAMEPLVMPQPRDYFQIMGPTRTAKKLPHREAQKQATIDLFRDTARTLFYHHGYNSVSVDAIAEVAGTTRATFYLYFRSKRDILMSILRQDLQAQMEVYEALAAMADLSWRSIREWLSVYRRQLESVNGSLALFSFAFDGETERSPVSIGHRDQAIKLLGERFASFDIETGDPSTRQLRRARVFAIIMMIEQVAMVFSTGEGTPDIEAGLDILADELHAFLLAGEKARGTFN